MKTRRTASGLTYVTFERAPATVHAVTTTRDVPRDPMHASLPGAALLADLDVDPGRIAWCAQVHGTRILASAVGGRQGEADALVTNRAGLFLSVRTADCAPVFLADPVRGAIGLVHAGWRGAADGVVGHAVGALHRLFGSRPEDMWAGIGPAIGPTAYEVGSDVARAFERAHVTPSGDRWLLDLPGAVENALARAGVRDIEPSGLCTVAANDRFFSYRHEGTTSRLYSLLWRAHESGTR